MNIQHGAEIKKKRFTGVISPLKLSGEQHMTPKRAHIIIEQFTRKTNRCAHLDETLNHFAQFNCILNAIFSH